jgi:hypothetical protein
MATGYVVIPAIAWTPPDNSTNNIAPAAQRIKGTQTNALHALVWGFDGAGSVPEQLYCSFTLPSDYASGGSLKVQGTVNGTTSANVVMQATVSAVTPADADTPLEHAFSTAATVTIANNTTEARRLLEGTITLNMDSAAAGDLLTIRLLRDPANGSDTLSALDFEFWSALFSYTTS